MATGTTPNSREPISAIDMITKESFYVEGTESTGAINVNATIGNSVTVAGTVTANAGTNLNTSALALETTLVKLNGFSMPVFDSIYPTFNSTTDVYVYKLSASTVATITISYSDATKAVMTSVIRT